MKAYLVPLAAALAMLAIAPPAFAAKYESSWLDGEITIDGTAPEWAGKEAYFDERDGLKIGFMNDGRFLYVYLSTWHQQIQRRILMHGLTVWFDAKGGKKETFGLSYPLSRSMFGPYPRAGEAPEDASTPPGGTGGEPRERGSGSSRNTQEMLKELLRTTDPSLLVVGAGKEPLAELVAHDSAGNGIEARIAIANRTLIYELRVPLAPGGSMPLAINAGPGGTVGIGFKTGTRDMLGMKERGDRPSEGTGNPPGGDMTGGGVPGAGGSSGGMGSRGGMPPGAEAKSLDLWFKVKLASGPAPAPAK